VARVKIAKPEKVDDPVVREIFDWVTQMEGSVPNHFYVEMNFPEFFKAKLGATKVLWQMGELSMDEIQHVGIAVSKANGCPYCTAAFCTILHHGRLRTLVEFALSVNNNAAGVTDQEIAQLRKAGLTDKGIVQLCHLVSDFASYNRLNLALQTDYDYRDMWRQLAFGGRTP
jgi:AhpD family alkylhydroperoxidase